MKADIALLYVCRTSLQRPMTQIRPRAAHYVEILDVIPRQANERRESPMR
jgi:hypothetical protein